MWRWMQAKALGDVLVVGLIPDREILAVKGPPVMNDAERMTMVSSLKWVDEVLTGAHPWHLHTAAHTNLSFRIPSMCIN
jgi:cytidyltransferase-like protein